MEGSFRGSENVSTPQWTSSPPRQGINIFTDSTGAANAADSSRPYRSLASRRRRILGRLTRAGSDPRSMGNTHSSSDGPEPVPETPWKTPTKRKASSQAKSGKPPQFATGVNSLNSTSSEPPIIKMEDVAASNQSAPRTNLLENVRELADPSDDDLELLELIETVGGANENPLAGAGLGRPNAAAGPLNLMVEYNRKRQDMGRMSSAILVSKEACFPEATGTESVRYLPLCPLGASGRFESANNGFLTVLQGHRDFVQRMQQGESQSKAVWPLQQLPVELFDLITMHLARDDVKSMRLVNQEFERKVSRSLFHTSVVPFNTEIYDMIDEDRKTVNRTPDPRSKGKGKLKAASENIDDSLAGTEMGSLQWENAKEDREGKVYKGHGLRVFQGFGPYIKRFGMSFEISEKQLCRPLVKKELDHIDSYHGSYNWPPANYARFPTLAGLENMADETSRMKAAFSNLKVVQEIALSVDSGLGWLNGPDKSLHGSIFEQPTQVFGRPYKVSDHATQAAEKFWSALEQSLASFDRQLSLKESILEYRPLASAPADLEGLRGNLYSNTELWSAMDSSKLSATMRSNHPSFGVLYTSVNQQSSDVPQRFPLMPNHLTKEQREWLLETQWAQQAFLESYMLAVIDNPVTFSNVSTLNIAKLSSRFLPMLAREAFWEALPCLSEVILLVSADWRTVEKDDAGVAQTPYKYPSDAARVFHREILQGRIASRKSIEKLKIGWVGGGEQAEGMFARNSNLLPAPITRPEHCTANSSILGIVLEHVKHLTLSNCWITPPALEGLVNSHAGKALQKLTLDSVSLTTHPKFPIVLPNAANVVPPPFFQAMAGMVPLQQGNPQPLAAGPQQLQAGQMALQQWHQQVQHMQANANHQLQFGQAPPQNIGQNVNNFNNFNPNGPTPDHWTDGHREGSWPQLLNSISPGPIFQDYLPPPEPWEEPLPPRAETNLRMIELISCGYAKLPHHRGFDQLPLEVVVADRQTLSPWFKTRYNSFRAAMMSTGDRNIGQIIQYMPQSELDAIQYAWGLTEGWKDRTKAEEAEFDGFMCGGTGRFSGVIAQGMELLGQQDASTSAQPIL